MSNVTNDCTARASHQVRDFPRYAINFSPFAETTDLFPLGFTTVARQARFHAGGHPLRGVNVTAWLVNRVKFSPTAVAARKEKEAAFQEAYTKRGPEKRTREPCLEFP